MLRKLKNKKRSQLVALEISKKHYILWNQIQKTDMPKHEFADNKRVELCKQKGGEKC